MPATSGSVTQIETSAATAVELAGTPDDQLKDGDLACVTGLWPNSTFRLRRLAFGTAPAPDNVSIISTYSGNGYWEVFGAGGNMLVFPNIAALEAYNDLALLDGATVYVQSVRSYWHKRIQAVPGTADGITNVQSIPNPTTTWYRDIDASPTWLNTAAWFIDPVAGNDEFPGNSAVNGALRTHAEFMRRLGQNRLTQSLTVTFVSGVDSGTFSHVMLPDQQAGFSVHYNAVLNTAVPALTGAVTNFHAISVVGNGERTWFTDTAHSIAVWNASGVGKMIVITASAVPAHVGAYAWIDTAVAGEFTVDIYTSPFTKATPSHVDPTIVNPQNGDTYAVVDLVAFAPTSFIVATDERTNRLNNTLIPVTFQYLGIDPGLIEAVMRGGARSAFFACSIGRLYYEGTSATALYGTAIHANMQAYEASDLTVSACYVDGRHHVGSIDAFTPSTTLTVDGDTLLAVDGYLSSSGLLRLYNVCAVNATGDVVFLDTQAKAYVYGVLYGHTNAAHFFSLGTRCSVINDAVGSTLLAATALPNVFFGGIIAKTWVQVPFISNALLTDSYAEWLNLYIP